MKVKRGMRPVLLGIALALALMPAGASAQDMCSADSFGDAVDESAAELRAFSSEAQPKLRQKLQALRDHKQWTEPDYETRGLAIVHDKKLDQFDAEASELLNKIDTLGTPEPTAGEAALSCANLAELKAASSELMAVMRAKSNYLIARIDREIASSPAAAAPREVAKAEPPASPAPAPAVPRPSAGPDDLRSNDTGPGAEGQPSLSPIRKTEQPKVAPPLAEELAPPAGQPPAAPETDAVEPASPKQAEREDGDERTSSWNTTTAQAVVPPPSLGTRTPQDPPSAPPNDAYDAPPPGVPYEYPPEGGPPGDLPTDEQAFDPEGGGYSIDEIREATRGFFGTVSTSLASVIEYTFKKSGQPTAYVLGTEGGGAFLAGLRYGEGTLFLRNGGSQKVYWHGPSIGYDLGAAGSRTLFLIYDLHEPGAVFRRFTGVDGSAYLVGGVGMTLLKGGPIVMAPIRSGLGLRLGASIGYVRFTPKPTWNPF